MLEKKVKVAWTMLCPLWDKRKMFWKYFHLLCSNLPFGNDNELVVAVSPCYQVQLVQKKIPFAFVWLFQTIHRLYRCLRVLSSSVKFSINYKQWVISIVCDCRDFETIFILDKILCQSTAPQINLKLQIFLAKMLAS